MSLLRLFATIGFGNTDNEKTVSVPLHNLPLIKSLGVMVIFVILGAFVVFPTG